MKNIRASNNSFDEIAKVAQVAAEPCSRRPKIGVFIVAYNAASTIRSVLDRISPEMWERIAEVFIFDDSSTDVTAEIAAHYRKEKQTDKIRIYYNQINLNYGGNQKRGYRYAMEHDFDIVIILHGDGQYAPEVMDRLIDPIEKGEADAVLGSRMMVKGDALRGGMPLYKYFGNRILTVTENAILGTSFSEFHSGYRAYSVSALKKIPFVKNSNDFHFDNEIIVQLTSANLKIIEVPIPTYYGGEICHVNGVKYAFNVMLTAIRYRLHCLGLYYDRSFDFRSGHQYNFKNNKYSSHRQIISMVDRFAAGRRLHILDVGCFSGFLAERFIEMGHHVVGVDIQDSVEARSNCDEFYVVDVCESFGVDEDRKFDCVVMADVIEHASNSEDILLRARRHLKPNGLIISSTGNVANLYIRLMLMCGQFSYTDRGIMDKTHRRLFTRRTIRNLFKNCGFRIVRSHVTPIPFEHITARRSISDALSFVNMMLAKCWPGLFSYQIIVEAELDKAATELLRWIEINDSKYKQFDAGAAE